MGVIVQTTHTSSVRSDNFPSGHRKKIFAALQADVNSSSLPVCVCVCVLCLCAVSVCVCVCLCAVSVCCVCVSSHPGP